MTGSLYAQAYPVLKIVVRGDQTNGWKLLPPSAYAGISPCLGGIPPLSMGALPRPRQSHLPDHCIDLRLNFSILYKDPIHPFCNTAEQNLPHGGNKGLRGVSLERSCDPGSRENERQFYAFLSKTMTRAEKKCVVRVAIRGPLSYRHLYQSLSTMVTIFSHNRAD